MMWYCRYRRVRGDNCIIRSAAYAAIEYIIILSTGTEWWTTAAAAAATVIY